MPLSELNLVGAFRKALGLYGRVYDFPVIVQYESGRLDSIASAQLKDIEYQGEAFEVLYAMRDLAFLRAHGLEMPKTIDQAAQRQQEGRNEAMLESLSDAEIQQFIEQFNIQEAI